MTPIWLTRLNGFLAWLNPALGLVAAALALMVVAAAAERVHDPIAKPAVEVSQPVQRFATLACPRAALPPEWRDMLLHD